MPAKDATTAFAPEELQLLDRLRTPGAPNDFEFRNWAGTFRCKPLFYLSPETESEIVQLIGIANRYGLTIKAIGSGHSPSDLACTNAIMLNMDKMNRIISQDTYSCRITVEAGVRLQELHEMLKQRNMALSSLGSISEQSIAGAIATATHGTGMEYGDLSSMITSLVIIDGKGIRWVCNGQKNKDLFDAARCSLGALGIITQVTIQCEPFFSLYAVQEPESLEYVLDNLPKVVHSAEHVRFWWFPYTDNTVVWKANRTHLDHIPSPESFVKDRLYGFHWYQLQLYKARFTPNDIPQLTKEHFANRFNRKLEWVDDGYKVFNFDCLFPQYVNEWAIPWENTPQALRQLRDWIDAENEKNGGVRVHFPIEVRFVKESDVWLSPAYDQIVCYIGVI
ncbi:D-arabinono-1,4-lactone oxidase, partial [Dipsacomyces acuminosporus]